MASSTDAMSKLKDAGSGVLKALGDRALDSVKDGVGGLTDKLEDVAGGGPIGKAVAQGGEAMATGESPVKGALKGAVSGVKDKVTGGGKGKGGGTPKATKAMNIIESIDVGVPIKVAYNQWTQYDQFPSFMKKVESVDKMKDEDTKVSWKAQVFWSHRSWEATVLEQKPDERIVWKSTGAKGRVDGAVSFHELGPNLTRILVVLEYYPQGFMERTGNIWRAAGRRARLEIKHFRRHVMTRTIQDPDSVEGWRGVIEDGEIVKTHDEVVEEEQQQQDEQDQQDSEDAEDAEEGYDDEYDDEEPAEDEESEDAYEDEGEGDEEEPEAEYDEGGEEDAEDEPEEEPEEEDAEEEQPRRRRRAS
jgi:Polyketide cyclase / dehydrase and lipid transport